MSVMVISPQMIADVTKKAQTFRTYGFSHEEKMMCPTLARMNDKDIKSKTYCVRDFFERLYIWNYLSYDLHYSRELTDKATMNAEFAVCQARAKDIDIYQFEMILRFLLYNIENYEFPDDFEDKEQMDADVELLQKIKDEVCAYIVYALQEEKGCEWCY